MSSLDLSPRLPLTRHPAPFLPRKLHAAAPAVARVQTAGKFFNLGGSKWYAKGFTYGPFAPNRDGEHLPERLPMLRDFAHMARLGSNCFRLYHIPPRWLLDEAVKHDLRCFIDVPWEKHRCFFEDWSSQQDARDRVRKTARLLGSHPATFAISVANEIPKDVVRFYGHKRVERFIDDLIDVVKQESPDCLATYTNYPSTEFVQPQAVDFSCFNVYLENPDTLSAYLDRLQHHAGNKPLILGEFGVDTIRHGQEKQAEDLATHVRKVFRHGLAGSFVFSYTDDWFTGGHQITDWAFGVTTKDRSPKLAASVLTGLWDRVPRVPMVNKDEGGRMKAEEEKTTLSDSSFILHPSSLPKVSVVVCSYNGARTLEECLHSLTRLNYPDYEVILVDDGSKDDTRAIASRYPSVQYIHQTNQGLSVARNVGAQAATGSVVAYTDSDCVADSDWLFYLVTAMLDQNVDAIGGPNVPPLSDGWTAKCVAASPGGPSHVMTDDRRAEHIPGCNMAFKRDALLAVGGFDPRYRVAGDDVDICWRFLDAHLSIGYSPSALVWHHRRNTIRAFFKQQAGYGRSEAMLHTKHPHRFNRLGCARWKGIIYGEGAVGLPVADPLIHHGRFGAELFQIIYRRNDYSVWSYFTLLEWHALSLFLLALALFIPVLAAVSVGMGILTLISAYRTLQTVAIPRNAPFWFVPTVFGLHIAQPVVRAYHRYKHRVLRKRLPRVAADNRLKPSHIRKVSSLRTDLYWTSDENKGREELLHALQAEVSRNSFEANFYCDWTTWDALITGDLWHNIRIHTATEELGWPRKFTRARCTLQPTAFTAVTLCALFAWTLVAFLTGHVAACGVGAAASAMALFRIVSSRRFAANTVARLLWRAGHHAKLTNVSVGPEAEERPAPAATPEAAVAKYAS